ncbi:Zinc finger, RING-type [Dillenia turbinata]|uniref:Zinc finger, RING-type n=1 Tax=Dillenia turbinata TaxID=194707 RepID=A0AAN8VM72_9MAGN
MGFSCFGLRVPIFSPSILVKLLLKLVISILTLPLSFLPFLEKLYSRNFEDFSTENPSLDPYLIPITPSYPVNDSLKKVLRLRKYGSLLATKSGLREDVDSLECAVCLCSLEGSHEVRELHNCCHFFHRECLDVWIDKGKVTCPVCRSLLLPN